jgi:hypothetical protein
MIRFDNVGVFIREKVWLEPNLQFFISLRLWRWIRQSVQESQRIRFRRRGITQKKACNKLLWCSRNSAYKIQTPGNYPAESMQQIIMMFRMTPECPSFWERLTPIHQTPALQSDILDKFLYCILILYTDRYMERWVGKFKLDRMKYKWILIISYSVASGSYEKIKCKSVYNFRLRDKYLFINFYFVVSVEDSLNNAIPKPCAFHLT